MNSNNSNEQPEVKTPTPAGILTPESQAYINASIASAVKDIFLQLAPVFKEIALTPDKINALKKPYQDPAHIARELRESQQTRDQAAQLRKEEAWRKANCPHTDKNGNDSICLMRNNLDNQPRGICVLCNDVIHPKEWRIGTVLSHPERPDHAYVVEAHKDYHRVVRILSMS